MQLPIFLEVWDNQLDHLYLLQARNNVPVSVSVWELTLSGDRWWAMNPGKLQ